MRSRRSIFVYIIGGLVILCGCVAASSIFTNRANDGRVILTAEAPPTVALAPAPTIAPALGATAAPRGFVSRAMLGEAWPLTIESGMLSCYLSGDTATKEVVLMAGDIYYAVNGTAKDSGKWTDIAPVWADNPSLAGTKIDMQPLVDAGLALCPNT